MHSKMKILITGGNGFLASNLREKLTEYDLTSISRDDFDLRDPDATNRFFKDKKFDVVLHTAIVGGNRLVEDAKDCVYDNSIMALNLLKNMKSWDRLIHFGSGAELDRAQNIEGNKNNCFNRIPADPYGLSKNVVCRLFHGYTNVYNLRIFNVFAKNEADRRMIKANIRNYLDKKPMVIHQDKYMDFFYIDDFEKLVRLYLTGEYLPREIDCVYQTKVKLSDVARIINNLDEHKVSIEVNSDDLGNSYCGHYESFTETLEYMGLENSIKAVYESMK